MGVKETIAATATIGQVFLIILNIIFALLAIGVVILGIVIRVNNVVDRRIVELLDRADFGGINIGDMLVVMSVVIIIVGVVTLLIAADGGIGACMRNRCLLITYIVVLCIIILIQIVIFGIWCKISFGANNWLKDQMDRIFQFYNGIAQDDEDVYSKGWNLMFMLLNCCGSSPISRFRNDFQMLSTYWWINPRRGFNVIPYTCCAESNIANYKFGNNRECTQQMQYYRPRGCHDAVKQLMNDFATPALVFSIILALMEIIAVISAILMVVQINRNRKRSVTMSNSNLYKQGGHDLPLPPDSKPLPSKPH